MEAHKMLEKKDFDVKSYGTGNHVKVPGALLLLFLLAIWSIWSN
jgi:hypothetical protein